MPTSLSSKFASIFGPSSLVQLVQYRAQTEPESTAFVYLTNGVDAEIVLTNSTLDRTARRIAAWLQKRNMYGQRILLLYPPGLDFISAFFGCLYAGAIAVPLYPPHRNRSILRIQSVAQSANAAIAFTTEDVIKRVENFIDEAPDLKKIPWVATTSLDNNLEEHWVAPDINTDTIAFLQYTSGSTGTPKGVILTHGNVIHNSRTIHTGFEHTRHDIGVFWLPSYHDMGLIGGIIQPLFCGCPNIIMSPFTFLQKPFRWLAAITKYRATTSGGPNFAYDLCVRQISEEQIDQLDLSCWLLAFNGAEPVLSGTMESFAKKFERCGFRYEAFYPCFGLAEGTLLVSGGFRADLPIICEFDAEALAVGKALNVTESTSKRVKLVSSGQKVLPDQKIAIVDPETCVKCLDRIVGEIWVSSPSVAKGYWQSPETTEQTFNAKITGGDKTQYMRTGDLGFMIEKELFVTGRIKDLIIVRGVNIYPQDIEATVQRMSEYLRPLAGAAFMVNDVPPNKDTRPVERLVIVQEVERKFKGDATHIYGAIRQAIALEHEITVEAIVLVKSGSIPKTSSGKIQRHACRNGFLNDTLSYIDRWVSPNVSFNFNNGNESYDLIPEAIGVPDSNDIERFVRGTIEPFVGGAPIKPIVPNSKPIKANHIIIKELPGETPNENTVLSLISREDLAAAVMEEVRKVAKERAANLTLDSDITALGLDSLERMEILASIEDRFGGQFPESILSELCTANQVLDAVLLYLGSGPRKPTADEQFIQADIPEEYYRIEKFPEYLRLKAGLTLIKDTELNRFFDVHEGITNDKAVIGGKEYINFSNYNYVNTSGDPAVIEAAVEACKKYGTSVSASRLVSGNKPIHRELENAISAFLGCEDTVVMVGGHSTNEGVIGHLLGEKDMILFDALSHNSIVEGAMLSGARRRPFPHNDWEAADWILKNHRREYRKVLIAVEGVYSMDGDYPDLPKLIEVKKRYRTLLMVDEAHSLGVLGKTGRGIGEHFGVDRKDVDIWMCTLSKTFASCGGYISGSRELIEFLKYTSPNFVFSVGISPPNCAAALAAIKLLEREPERVKKLHENCKLFLQLAKSKKLNTGMSCDSAVVPVIIGNSILALRLSKALFERGINVQPILHPAVEEKAARLRFFITSAHNPQQIEYSVNCTAQELEKLKASNEIKKNILLQDFI
ncbi:MAG: aminotransferase class I/II-fold pyridoxal phosphate-dependent enzyme [Planctomycetaceae bacterium]|nr:aminotransferase class I/II-fold pyridoxal phosphate-dependent enzyme [Planctomycetaceae bacterium]